MVRDEPEKMNRNRYHAIRKQYCRDKWTRDATDRVNEIVDWINSADEQLVMIYDVIIDMQNDKLNSSHNE